ncbi:competence protein CoiA family protein [Anoxybacillus sp. TBDG-1]
MERAFDQLGKLVHAKEAHKYGVDYTCPCCGARVFKAEGRIQSAHFRHERGQGSERCELYAQRLTSSSRFDDYSAMVSRPFITFEEDEDDWNLFITFPYLTPSQARQCDLHHLHFKIKCNEMDSFISSAHLWPNSNENKLQIVPKESYSFSFVRKEDERCYGKLGLFWPEYMKGFRSNVYLFQLINKNFCMIESKELSLNDTFYMVSRKKIDFPGEMFVKKLNKKYGWYAYKIQLPYVLTDSLIKLFQQFGYFLKPPYYYLDIVVPSVFRRKNDAFFIEEKECVIQVTFRDFKPQNFYLIHIHPNYTSTEYRLSDNYFNVILDKKGFHTFYIKNQEGKMLHLYYGEKMDACSTEMFDSSIVVDQQKLMLFKEKNISTYHSISVKGSSSFPYWLKEKNKFARKLDYGGDFFYPSVEKIFIPGIWSFSFLLEEDQRHDELDWQHVLLSYMQLDQRGSSWISNEQYTFFKKCLKGIHDKNLQSKLTYYLKLCRNRVPLVVKEFIQRVRQ